MNSKNPAATDSAAITDTERGVIERVADLIRVAIREAVGAMDEGIRERDPATTSESDLERADELREAYMRGLWDAFAAVSGRETAADREGRLTQAYLMQQLVDGARLEWRVSRADAEAAETWHDKYGWPRMLRTIAASDLVEGDRLRLASGTIARVSIHQGDQVQVVTVSYLVPSLVTGGTEMTAAYPAGQQVQILARAADPRFTTEGDPT
jgi:hypothetical protein